VALALATAVDNGYACSSDDLSAVVTRLQSEQRLVVLEKALVVVHSIADEGGRSHALVGLAPHLGQNQLGAARTVARGIGYEYYHSHALVVLLPHLGPEQRPAGLEALAAAKAMFDKVDFHCLLLVFRMTCRRETRCRPALKS